MQRRFNLAIAPILLLAVSMSLTGTSKCLAQANDQPAHQAKTDDLGSLAGEWLYVADHTEGRPAEKHSPPMSVKFELRVEGDIIVMPRRGWGERFSSDPWAM